jgi:anti-anti-sigma factor
VPIAKIDVHNEAKQILVAVRGEIDLSVHDDLTTALAGAVSRAHGRQVVVDLSHTSFMDATGVHALLGGMRAAKEAGTGFRVVGVSGSVALVLKATRVLEALTGPGAVPRPASS